VQIREQKVAVGRYSLSLKSAGTGTPTVIMDAGAGDTSESWATIQPHVASFTQVCTYDRAGTGQSDVGPTPTTSRQIVHELHLLLINAHIPSPYVLVGHSFGGLNMRLYASYYPDEVVGMVLVDSAHEAMYAHLDIPTPLDGTDYTTSAQQVRATQSLDDRPLIILSHGLFMPGVPEAVTQMWLPCQKKLAHLSSNSVLVIATKSGHFIQADQPEIVIEAIRQVVEAVRNQSHALPPCEETFRRFDGLCVDAENDELDLSSKQTH